MALCSSRHVALNSEIAWVTTPFRKRMIGTVMPNGRGLIAAIEGNPLPALWRV